MVNANKAVGLVVGLLIMGLMSAFLFPIVIDSMSGAEEATYNQSVGETIELQPDLEATLDASTAGTSAEYTINASGDTATATVNEGANDTVTVDGIDVTIGVSDASSGNATATYSYPTTYGWGAGAGSLWVILPIILVLAVFLYFVGTALGYL